MAQQTINVGTVANDGTGDALRAAFQKVNANFAELYLSVSYSLPAATPQTLGGVRPDGTTLAVNGAGVMSVIGEAGFTFAQPTAATVWTINHGLGRFPQVTVVDPTGRQLDADVTFTNANQVVVSGEVAFAGTAYLS